MRYSQLVLILLTAALGTGVDAESNPMTEAVQSESTFEGAVTVVDSSSEGSICYVTVEVPYRDVYGNTRVGQGRLMARPEDMKSGKLLPPFCNVHYEMTPDTAQSLCQQGWIVMTPHYGEPDKKTGYVLELAVANSYNLSNALIQWVRRLPFIDRGRLFISGSSAGGYMALAMGANMFPVAAVQADFPVLNWGYNLSYFESNTATTGYRTLKETTQSATPLLCAVSMLTDWAYGFFGNDLSADTYYHMSPISYLDRITCPVLVTTATGDLLVPIEQTAPSHACKIAPETFGPGFERSLAKLGPAERMKMSLEELLPRNSFEEFIIPDPGGLHEFGHGDFDSQAKLAQHSPPTERPWSKEHQWSIVILDEGPPIPTSAHSRYSWNLRATNFTETHRSAIISSDILTPGKLEWLLQRFNGTLPVRELLHDGTPVNRTNFGALEKRDVLLGLLDFARISEEHEARLKTLYAAGALKPFGAEPDLKELEAQLGQLAPH